MVMGRVGEEMRIGYRICSVRKENVFFFFKQQTGYEVQYGPVGSEVCFRDRFVKGNHALFQDDVSFLLLGLIIIDEQHRFCLLYTFDAADEVNSVDLGGR